MFSSTSLSLSVFKCLQQQQQHTHQEAQASATADMLQVFRCLQQQHQHTHQEAQASATADMLQVTACVEERCPTAIATVTLPCNNRNMPKLPLNCGSAAISAAAAAAAAPCRFEAASSHLHTRALHPITPHNRCNLLLLLIMCRSSSVLVRLQNTRPKPCQPCGLIHVGILV
jgi:hypothetical protein